VKDGPVEGLADAIGKTGTRNRTEAALLARRNGWL
jgi:DNA-binding CsgD family transcriptional regulator